MWRQSLIRAGSSAVGLISLGDYNPYRSQSAKLGTNPKEKNGDKLKSSSTKFAAVTLLVGLCSAQAAISDGIANETIHSAYGDPIHPADSDKQKVPQKATTDIHKMMAEDIVKVVRSRLKDPDSMKIVSIAVDEPVRVALGNAIWRGWGSCIMYNAKNSFGGYGGVEGYLTFKRPTGQFETFEEGNSAFVVDCQTVLDGAKDEFASGALNGDPSHMALELAR
jgi:hypothetical protein